MAVDTRNERASILGIALPFGFPLPNPDGTIDQGDRQHTALSYPGILTIEAMLWTDVAAGSLSWSDVAAGSFSWSDVAGVSTTWTEA